MTKLENNWRYKSLENLERNVWPPLDKSEGSYLINTCHQLRKKQLIDFTIEDLRIMIGQDIGLKYLIPIAIEKLEENILAEGHFYEGDLLKNVLSSDQSYWKKEYENWKSICQLFEKNMLKLKEFETTKQIRKGLFESYEKFKNYYK